MSRSSPLHRRSPLLGTYALLVFAFLYLPIVVLVLYSFNRQGVGGFPPKQLTLDWYRLLFRDSAIWDSVLNSLLVAVGAVVLSLTLGLLAALALDRATFPGKSIFRRLVLLPLILPGIITGLSLLMFAVFAGLQLSLVTVFLGHGTALISVATTELFAGLLIFTLSMDEIAVTFFLIGRDNTLPLEIWARLRRGITPEINAISTLIFAVSVILILVWYQIRARTTGKEAQELLERP